MKDRTQPVRKIAAILLMEATPHQVQRVVYATCCKFAPAHYSRCSDIECDGRKNYAPKAVSIFDAACVVEEAIAETAKVWGLRVKPPKGP